MLNICITLYENHTKKSILNMDLGFLPACSPSCPKSMPQISNLFELKQVAHFRNLNTFLPNQTSDSFSPTQYLLDISLYLLFQRQRQLYYKILTK